MNNKQSDTDKFQAIDNQLNTITDALNQNSMVIGMLINALGIVLNERDGKQFMSVAIPNDPKILGGFLSRLVRDVENLKKNLPQGIVLASNIREVLR